MHDFFLVRLELFYARGASDVPDDFVFEHLDFDLHAATAAGDAFLIDAV